MIYDKIENLSNYSLLIPNFKEIEKTLKFFQLKNFKEGRQETSDPSIYYNEAEYMTSTNKLYEAHKDVIDLQIVVAGKEKAKVGNYDQDIRFDENGNALNLVCNEKANFELDSTNFILFFPREMHCPGLANPEPSNVKKIIFKIKVNQ